MKQTADERQLHVAEVTLRTFAKSAAGPGDRPQLLAVLLAEYDRRAERIAELEKVAEAGRYAIEAPAGDTRWWYRLRDQIDALDPLPVDPGRERRDGSAAR